MGKTLGPYKTSRSGHLLFTQSCLTLFDSMVCKMPGFLVLHCLPEFVHTRVHRLDDAIQPSCPLSPTFSCPQSFPASGSFPGSQLFASGGQCVGALASASVLPVMLQGGFPLGLTGLITSRAGISQSVLLNSSTEMLEPSSLVVSA